MGGLCKSMHQAIERLIKYGIITQFRERLRTQSEEYVASIYVQLEAKYMNPQREVG